MLRELLLRIPYIQYLGYVLVFFAAFLEALPAVGLFIPGQTIVILAGILTQQQVLTVHWVLTLAIVGAILGDMVAFIIGKKYGTGLFKGREGIINDMTRLLRQHPIKTLVIGRFNSITRAFAPFAAGASGVRTRSFFFANIIGGILWGTAFTLLGYIFGASYQIVSGKFDKILLAGATIFTVTLLIYYYLKKSAGVSHRATVLLIMNVLSIIMFSAVTYSLLRGESMTLLDSSVHKAFTSLHQPVVDSIAVAFTSILQVVVVSVVCAGVFVLIWRKSRREATLFAFTVVSGLILDRLLKMIFMRERPLDGLLTIDLYGYPSGHAMMGTIVLGAFVLTYRQYTRWKRAFAGTAITLVVLVALSRLYIGVHWLSDVLGGITFGLFWLTFVFLCDELYESYTEDKKKRYAKFTAKLE